MFRKQYFSRLRTLLTLFSIATAAILLWLSITSQAQAVVHVNSVAIYSHKIQRIDIHVVIPEIPSKRNSATANFDINNSQTLTRALIDVGKLDGILLLALNSICSTEIITGSCMPIEVARSILRANSAAVKVIALCMVYPTDYDHLRQLNVLIRSLAREAHWFITENDTIMNHLRFTVGIIPDKIRVIPFTMDDLSQLLCLKFPMQPPYKPLPEVELQAV